MSKDSEMHAVNGYLLNGVKILCPEGEACLRTCSD